METVVQNGGSIAHRRINCTLRNGNIFYDKRVGLRVLVLIVPCGMETSETDTLTTLMIVLIVPCGMETCLRNGLPPATNVLIVPCGMETSITLLYHFGFTAVLIVPCGMETKDGSIYTCWFLVLIVPCGMETR